MVGLRGPSGSGKSTLLNIIACITEPSAGRLALGAETENVVWLVMREVVTMVGLGLVIALPVAGLWGKRLRPLLTNFRVTVSGRRRWGSRGEGKAA